MKNTKIRFLSNILTLAIVAQLLFVSTVVAFNTDTLVNSSLTAHRISGIDRYATADALSEKFKASDTIIIINGDNFPDALSAGPLAKKYNAPMLLSNSLGLNASSLAEIVRLKATKAIIVGGIGIIPTSVDSQLTAIGVNSTRLAGKDRYETSLLVAKQLSNITSVTVVYGEDFPDALSISAIASKLGMPIILSSKSGLSSEALNFVKNCGATKTYIINSNGVLPNNIAQSVSGAVILAGTDKYDTDQKVLAEFATELNFDNVYLTTGENFADALTGSVVAASTSSPVILVGSTISDNLSEYLKGHITLNTKVIALGGTSAIPDHIVAKVMDDKASVAVGKVYSSAGTFTGDTVKGSAIISAPNVNLKDITINGNLLISSTVADGSIDLNNVKVTGKVIVNGSSSLLLHNITLSSLTIDKPFGKEANVITDTTSSVIATTIDNNGVIDASVTSKSGTVLINNGAKATLKGLFNVVNVAGADSYTDTTNATIAAISINSTANNSTIETSSSTKFTTLNIYAKVDITGGATITNANISSNGSIIGSNPEIIILDKGITSTICGKTVSTSTVIPVIDPSKLDTSVLSENITAAQLLVDKAATYSAYPNVVSILRDSVARLKSDISIASNINYNVPTQEQAQLQVNSFSIMLAQDMLNFNTAMANALNQ